MEIGEPVAVVLPEPAQEAQPPAPTVRPRWSKPAVTPDHNRRWPPNAPPRDAVPDEATVRCIVYTTNVPDGTQASITIHHCHTGALVPDGTLNGLEVRANRVVDPNTGSAAQFVFDAHHKPWDPWDKPFFFFKVAVQYQGLRGETPRDFDKQPRLVLRVLYWHACVADRIADTVDGLTTRDEMREIAGILGRQPHHKVYQRAFNQRNVVVNLWGSVLRNTYTYHQASHGDVVDRATGAEIPTPPNPPTAAVGNWQSVVLLGNTTFGDREVNQAGNVPSVPRYLVYMDTCVAGWEPSLGNAFINRGTQNYIGFRKFIGDTPARSMARRFYRKWVRTYRCDPARIPQLFWDVGSPFYKSMRPVLIGQGGGAIERRKAANALNAAFAGLMADIDAL